jgi:hypothetical protein
VTKHDPATGQVQFARFTPQSRICLLKIAATARDEHRSFVDIAYTFTGLAKAGNNFIEACTEEKFREAMTFWEEAINHYLATE